MIVMGELKKKILNIHKILGCEKLASDQFKSDVNW